MPAPNEPVTMPRPDIGEATRAENRLGPVYNVVCWNDPVNLMVYVTHVFMKIFGWNSRREHLFEIFKPEVISRQEAEQVIELYHST